MSGPDRALEEAAEALKAYISAGGKGWDPYRDFRAEAEATVSAYLGALRRELPEEAITAACQACGHDPEWKVYRTHARKVVLAALAALTGEGRPDADV